MGSFRKKKESDLRPASYEVNQYTVGHLRVLHNKFSELIEILRPAFEHAEIRTWCDPTSRTSVLSSSGRSQFYKSPSETMDWVERRVRRLEDLINRLSNNETKDLSGLDLNCLRKVRMFCISFKSAANSKYGNRSNFKISEKEIADLLSHRAIPKPTNAGIFDLSNYLLKEEDIDYQKDWGKAGQLNLKATIRDIVGAHKELKSSKETLQVSLKNAATIRNALPQTVAPSATAESAQLLLNLR